MFPSREAGTIQFWVPWWTRCVGARWHRLTCRPCRPRFAPVSRSRTTSSNRWPGRFACRQPRWRRRRLAGRSSGGDREREAVLKHVYEGERADAPKVGFPVPPRISWDEQRAMILAGLLAAQPDSAWPVRYTIRRLAWHILDHAWEMEDRVPRRISP